MRQIKNFMEAKRPMWNCNECKCITMQCWKESEAFCGCGDNGGGGVTLGNKSYLQGTLQEGIIKFFTTSNSGEDYMGRELPNLDGAVGYGIFNSEGGNALAEILTSTYGGTARVFPFMIGKGGTFPSDGVEGTIDSNAMSLVENVFNAPTEANKQVLMDAIDNAIDALQGGDLDASFVTYSVTGTVITIAGSQTSIPLGGEFRIASVAVTPDTETVTVASSDTSVMAVRAEKIPDTPINGYDIYGEGLSTGTVTVTITGVNDPTASASFSIDVLR